MTYIPPEVEMSIAILTRHVLEHTEPGQPLSVDAERVDAWIGERLRREGMLPRREEQVVHD